MMQYILTQEEYNELIKKKELQLQIQMGDLQELCTKIANEMPISYSWKKEIEPWGCILNNPDRTCYCDDCPVQEICPCPFKRWSK